MAAFIYNDREVYDAKDVKEKDPGFFFGCSISLRAVVEKQGIPADAIFYAIKTRGNWTASDAAVKRASLLLDKEWVDTHVPKFMDADAMPKSAPKKGTYLSAPDILELDDSEKLCDDEGNIYEIEVRGERNVDKCYFRASDVELTLGMKNITGTLQDITSAFVKGKDYVSFIVKSAGLVGLKIVKHPHMFLTYLGLMRLLFVRRHPIAEKFQRWAAETLFTVKHGTSEAKETLASNLLGTEISSIKSFLSADTRLVFPVIYLFIIGRIGDLRDDMKIDTKHEYDDNGLVAKFGYTKDLKRRASEHANTFGKFKGAKIYLRCFAYIDPEYLSKAEKELHDYFETEECLVSDNKSYVELVVLNKQFVKSTVFDKYKSIGAIYEGRYANMRVLEAKLEKLNEILINKDEIIAAKEKIFAERERVIIEKERVITEKEKTSIMLLDYLHIKDKEIAKLSECIDDKNKIIKKLNAQIDALKYT